MKNKAKSIFLANNHINIKEKSEHMYLYKLVNVCTDEGKRMYLILNSIKTLAHKFKQGF